MHPCLASLSSSRAAAILPGSHLVLSLPPPLSAVPRLGSLSLFRWPVLPMVAVLGLGGAASRPHRTGGRLDRWGRPAGNKGLHSAAAPPAPQRKEAGEAAAQGSPGRGARGLALKNRKQPGADSAKYAVRVRVRAGGPERFEGETHHAGNVEVDGVTGTEQHVGG